jgi:hypothetical protein
MQIWNKAETILQEADHWCFIGYSLPEADRYFHISFPEYIISEKQNRLRITDSRVSVVNINNI